VPAVTPTPATESQWQCDPNGGIACFDDLLEVTMISPNEGWAGGSKGVVLHYTTKSGDSVPTWQRVEPDLAIPFHKLVMVGPTEGWGLGTRAEAGFVHYQNGQWEASPPLPGHDLAMVSPDEGWSVSNAGTISHYYNQEWHEVVPPRNGQEDLRTIAMVNRDEGWAAGSNNALFHYDGQQWQPVPREGRSYFGWLSDMEIVGESEIWAGGDWIYHFKDAVWQRVSIEGVSGVFTTVFDISMIDTNEGWAVGLEPTTQNGLLYHYKDNQWQVVESPTTNYLNAIDMINANEGWAVGSKSTILHYLDGTWTVVSEAIPPMVLADIAWPDVSTGWGVARDRVWRHTNETWQLIDTPDEFTNVFDLDMLSSEEGWFAGEERLWHYNQGTWQSYSPGATAIDMINPQEGWAVGAEGRILHYTNGQWQEMNSPTSALLTAVSMVDEQEGWAVGYYGTLLHYQNRVWEVVSPVVENDLKEVQMFSKSDGSGTKSEGWALSEGVLLRYQNEVWQKVNLPESNPILHTMYMFNINEGWLVSSNGILHYKDGEWEIFALPLPVFYSAIYMLNEHEGWAAGEGILHYTNK
jgi:photosystem II stability/assembly factor-like uncharacterized protein